VIELRPYQQKAINEARQFFASGGKHAIIQSPTGSGKTVMFSYISENIVRKNNKVLIITDREELQKQAGGTLRDFNLQPFFIKAGTKYINHQQNVYVAMAKTLQNRLNNDLWRKWFLNDIDLVIIDECHIQTTNYLFEDGLMKDKKVLSFTATPKRSGKMRQLGLDYEKIIHTVSVKELIELGYLVNDDYYGVGGVNLQGLKFDKMKGDYSEGDMYKRFNSAKLYKGVVKNWRDVANNTQTIVFCVNIEHAIKTCEEFQSQGVNAKFVVSNVGKPKEPKEISEGAMVRCQEKMKLYEHYQTAYKQWSGERSSLIAQFKRKEITVLINASILTTGFDEPTIETVIVNRATSSMALWLQMIGRGSRITPNKSHFTVLDFGDNASRLGHYTAPQRWSLWHDEGGKGTGIPPVKICGEDLMGKKIVGKSELKGCERMIMAMYKICPFCGFHYPDKSSKEVELVGVAYDSEKFSAVAVKKVSEMNINELYSYYRLKRHKPAWLWRQLYYKGGEEMLRTFGKQQNWTNGTIEKSVQYVKGF
jgi:superfamily II DNA or RNA helicase